jgi:phosphatidylglycerol:prolipoprotein diacylglycerol transferase
MYLFAKKYKTSFLKLADAVCFILPLGLFFGRIGNYFNKELLGFPYTGPLAVVTEKGSFFPSPLLEALME